MKSRHLLIIITLCLALQCCSDRGIDNACTIVNFPTKIYLQKKSPDKETTAIIYSWPTHGKANWLGSNLKFILGFTNKTSKWYVDFELSEGFGTYEGGITEIQWINDNEVLIKRVISDRPKDIKYNLKLNEWAFINTPE